MVGPKGKIIVDNVGYIEASKVYEDETKKYKNQVEEEFKKLNTNK